MALATVTCAFTHNIAGFLKRVPKDFESSGNGPDEPTRGSVRTVKVSPHFLRPASGMFGQRAQLKDTPHRSSFPAFLALGRPGPSSSAAKPVASLPYMHGSYTDTEAKKRQGLEMWQRVMHRNENAREVLSLPFVPKDITKQSCSALPFTQRITEEGCEAASVHNKLCFGQCSSLFVPPNGESTGHHSAPCSRCAPAKARTVLVILRCGTQVREKHVMVVEECKCETSREEGKVESLATHL
ncbi:DAN domain family member 5 [Electrophorus electricus]|uniref:DAN domain family member 5 n=1 Tax=Electrophorus electricus TaxID=8005 RepID=UPI0015CFA4D0|nr:DAN domain family member 5 [Electrophorus electricus]